ncbi:hypothetical protein ACW95P_02435 [Candidatus Mycoplasma pogonae]
MFIPLDLMQNQNSSVSKIVQTSKYYDVRKDEIENFSVTLEGNLLNDNYIINGIFNKKGIKPIKHIIPGYQFHYPGYVYDRPFTSYVPPQEVLNESVQVSGWISWGGSGKVSYEHNIEISWKDIETFMRLNNFDSEKLILESIELIPEINVINNPLNKAVLTFDDLEIELNENKIITKNDRKIEFNVPSDIQWQEWKGSGVFQAFIESLDSSDEIKFIKKSDLKKSLEEKKSLIKKEELLMSFVNLIYNNSFLKTNLGETFAQKNSTWVKNAEKIIKLFDLANVNYDYTIFNLKDLSTEINLNEKVNKGSNIKINIKKMTFEGWKNQSFADYMEAKISNIFVKLNFKNN